MLPPSSMLHFNLEDGGSMFLQIISIPIKLHDVITQKITILFYSDKYEIEAVTA
jgi:hypothetical protein